MCGEGSEGDHFAQTRKLDAEVKKEQDKNKRTVAVEDRAANHISQQSISRDLLMVLHLKAVKELTTHYIIRTFILDSRISLLTNIFGDHGRSKAISEEYQQKSYKEAVFQCDAKKIETKEARS